MNCFRRNYSLKVIVCLLSISGCLALSMRNYLPLSQTHTSSVNVISSASSSSEVNVYLFHLFKSYACLLLFAHGLIFIYTLCTNICGVFVNSCRVVCVFQIRCAGRCVFDPKCDLFYWLDDFCHTFSIEGPLDLSPINRGSDIPVYKPG